MKHRIIEEVWFTPRRQRRPPPRPPRPPPRPPPPPLWQRTEKRSNHDKSALRQRIKKKVSRTYPRRRRTEPPRRKWQFGPSLEHRPARSVDHRRGGAQEHQSSGETGRRFAGRHQRRRRGARVAILVGSCLRGAWRAHRFRRAFGGRCVERGRLESRSWVERTSGR